MNKSKLMKHPYKTNYSVYDNTWNMSYRYVLHRMDTFEEVSQKIYKYSSLSISSIIFSAHV